jgi:hypothetical protein
MNDALRRLEREWQALVPVDVDDRVAHAAGSVAVRHGLHGMGAIHLASALIFADARPVLVTWDAELRRAARAEGLAVSV